MEPAWRDLLKIRDITLDLEQMPKGTVWAAGSLARPGAAGAGGAAAHAGARGRRGGPAEWLEQPATWTLRLQFPSGVPIPTPDPWTFHTLQETGIVWRWSDQALSLVFAKQVDHAPEAATAR